MCEGSASTDGLPTAGAAEELALLYDTAPVGLCVLDTTGRFLRVNRRMAEINGVPAAAHLGRTMREVVPALAEAGEALLRRVIDTGAPVLEVEVEGETQAAPGTRRTWIEDWSPLHDEAGAVVAVNIVTREREAARALRESEARLHAVLDALPVGVGVMDAQGRVLLSNPEMRRFTPAAMPSADAARRDRWVGHHPDGSRIAPSDFPGQRALRGERVVPGIEFRVTLDDGTEAWARVAAVPLLDEAGRVTGVVANVTDVTAARDAAERQALLTREMTHRAKNTLAVIKAALRMTPREDAAAYAAAVERRVDALARAHALLAEGMWEGAALRPLIEAELAAFLGDGAAPAVTLDGRGSG